METKYKEKDTGEVKPFSDIKTEWTELVNSGEFDEYKDDLQKFLRDYYNDIE